MRTITVFTIWFWASFAAFAAETDTLTPEDATGALTLALTQGIDAAVGRLGVTNGFLDNPKVKITLPGSLQVTQANTAITKLTEVSVSLEAGKKTIISQPGGTN